MSQTNINVRMDENLKRQFETFCSNIGMTMTTAFCVFAKTVVREQKIPFEIKADIPNADTLQAIQEVEDMIRNGTGKQYNSIQELFKELDA
jgi:DNA-damage-inducible protein J